MKYPLTLFTTINMVVVALFLCLVSACGTKLKSLPSNEQTPIKRSIVDRLDRHVAFDTIPTRIVSLSPSTTELLFAIGLGPSIVGRTEHCNYPPKALDIPTVGSGTLEGISRETILSLKPDLILCKWDSHQPLIETFERLEIPIVGFGPENIQEMFDEAKSLGNITGHEQQAEQLIQQMTDRLNKLKAVVANHASTPPKKVFYQVWDSPLMTAGPKTFIGELLNLAGFENVFQDLTTRYPRVSAEVIVERNPEIIFAPTTHSTDVKIEAFASRPGWAEVSAVQRNQIFIIDGDQVSRCGPRLLDALEQMIQLAYPGSITEPAP